MSAEQEAVVRDLRALERRIREKSRSVSNWSDKLAKLIQKKPVLSGALVLLGGFVWNARKIK